MTGSAHFTPATLSELSPAAAERAIKIVSDLADLRARSGRAAVHVEAIAMLNASLSALRVDFGSVGIRRALQLAEAENRRLEDRDRMIVANQAAPRRRRRRVSP